MNPDRPTEPPTVVARIAMNDSDCLQVSLDTVRGATVVDLRVFSRFTPARVLMPTRHAIAVAPHLVPELIAALQAVHHAMGATA